MNLISILNAAYFKVELNFYVVREKNWAVRNKGEKNYFEETTL